MTDFNINAFGSLTTSAGKKLEFKDFDKDNDGKISEEEYNSLLKEVQLDNVEMSSVDKNDDKMIDEKEFTSWENKIEMQNVVNDMAKQIAVDFVGDNASKIKDLQNEFKYFIEDFAKNYSGKDIVNDFRKALPAKYEELKLELLGQTRSGNPSTSGNLGNIQGSSLSVNPNLIDYTKIDGYFDGGQIHERGKGWSGSKDKAMEVGAKYLNNDALKSQIKAQILKDLKDQNVSDKRFETIFENVYQQSIQDTLNIEDMITGRGARGLSSKGHAYINKKNLVDSFITKFNENIAKVVDEMNLSDKDMDLQDLDYSVLGGKEYNKETLRSALMHGKLTLDDVNNSSNYYEYLYRSGKDINESSINKPSTTVKQTANDLVDKLKPQMLAKAQAMCAANGVEFDEKVFNTMFNNAKGQAIANAYSENITNVAMNIQFNYKLNVQTLVNSFTEQFKEIFTQWVNSDEAKSINNSNIRSINNGDYQKLQNEWKEYTDSIWNKPEPKFNSRGEREQYWINYYSMYINYCDKILACEDLPDDEKNEWTRMKNNAMIDRNYHFRDANRNHKENGGKTETFNDVYNDFKMMVPDCTTTVDEKRLAISFIDRMLSCDDIPADMKTYWIDKKEVIEAEIKNME